MPRDNRLINVACDGANDSFAYFGLFHRITSKNVNCYPAVKGYVLVNKGREAAAFLESYVKYYL